MTNKNLMEYSKIKHMDDASWFKTINHYPQTFGHLELLVSVVDRMGIFDNFDISKICQMDEYKLNIFYAILRITNKVFNGYVDFTVKKIFIHNLMQLFPCNEITAYDLFFDQLTQDLDHFVCITFKSMYPKMDESIIKLKFINYLKSNFDKNFYKNILKKLNYLMDKNFYSKNDKFFSSIIHEFVSYTKETLTETYETMTLFSVRIFDTNCSRKTTNEIIDSIKKHINLDSLFNEYCMELDIYCEQKLDDIWTKKQKKNLSKKSKPILATSQI